MNMHREHYYDFACMWIPTLNELVYIVIIHIHYLYCNNMLFAIQYLRQNDIVINLLTAFKSRL